MELNPNSEMLNQVRDYWQNLMAVVVHKLGGELTLTTEDIEAARGAPEGLFLQVEGKTDRIELRLVTKEEAIAAAKREGGLPS